MLAALATGVRRPEVLADKALGSLRGKIPNLILALDGRPDAHFQWMLSDLLRRICCKARGLRLVPKTASWLVCFTVSRREEA